MHAGALHDPVVLDWLEELAPVIAVSGNGDYSGLQRTEPPTDPRLRESRVLTVDAPSTGSGRSPRIGLGPDPPPAAAGGAAAADAGGANAALLRRAGRRHRAGQHPCGGNSDP